MPVLDAHYGCELMSPRPSQFDEFKAVGVLNWLAGLPLADVSPAWFALNNLVAPAIAWADEFLDS
jgi:hypothetical protein